MIEEQATSDLAGRSRVQGQLVDAESGAPISGASIEADDGTSVLTDQQGRFLLTLAPGDRLLMLERLGYGSPMAELHLAPDVAVELRLLAPPRAIPLDSLAVQGTRDAPRRSMARTSRVDVLEGEELEASRRRGETVGQAVDRFPGIRVREGRFSTVDEVASGVCVESNRPVARLAPASVARNSRVPFCDPLAVFVDGVHVGNPIAFLRSLRLDEFASVEVLNATDAAIRFGTLAGNGGALLLQTRRR